MLIKHAKKIKTKTIKISTNDWKQSQVGPDVKSGLWGEISVEP